MTDQLAYVMITPYSLYKSRTGGIIGRLLAHAKVELVATRMYVTSDAFTDAYQKIVCSKATDEPMRKAWQDYLDRWFRPTNPTGLPPRCMLLLFRGPNAVKHLKEDVIGGFTESPGGDTVRGTYGDYIRDADGTMHVMLRDVGTSNGIAWSLDRRTMYYIDTPRCTVDAFDYDLETGAIANRRVAIAIPPVPGHPDGSTLDAEGMLWVAHCGGGCVTRWDPRTGQQLATVTVPTPLVTSCAFGGPRLDRLYITTARRDATATTLAGGLFCAEVGVKGLEAFEFAG